MANHAEYSPVEMMVIAAAREINNGERVFTGTYLPILPALLAKRNHATDIMLFLEGGIVYDDIPSCLPLVATDHCLATGALFSGDTLNTLGLLLHGGHTDVGLISANSVDKYGNINTTCIGDYYQPKARLAGSGGACDFGCLCPRTVIILEHHLDRFPEKVDFITTPGYLDGNDSRQKLGMRTGGPSAVVTTLGLFRFESDTKEMYLDSLHPGVGIDELKLNIQWEIKISPQLKETSLPTVEELRVLREEVDPQGMYLKNVRANLTSSYKSYLP